MNKRRILRGTALALAAAAALGLLAHGTALADEAVPVTGIVLDSGSLSLVPTQPAQLTPTVEPADATDRAIVWSSGNPNVATVSEEGEIMALAEGEAVIKASTADGGIWAECTVTVAHQIASPKYQVGGGVVSGVTKYTTVNGFKSNLYNGSSVRVYGGVAEVTSGSVATGMAAVCSVGGSERDRRAIVVTGDVNGDGLVTISDYTLARLHILGLKALEGPHFTAADVGGDGNVTISDYTLIRLDILGLKTMGDPVLPDLPEVTDPRIQAYIALALAQLGDRYVLGARGPDTFDCSGLVYYCLSESGYSGSLWRTNADTYSKWSDWLYVNRANLQPGDLLFFRSDSNPNRIGHVGIYLGNNYLVHASSSNASVIVSKMTSWYDRQLSHARRVYY